MFKDCVSTPKQRYKKSFDLRKRVKGLAELEIRAEVWIKDFKLVSKVQKKLYYPRSYLVKVGNGGVYCRNRWHLVQTDAKYETLANLQEK